MCVSCPDVERYSDKYHSSEQTDALTEWTPGNGDIVITIIIIIIIVIVIINKMLFFQIGKNSPKNSEST